MATAFDINQPFNNSGDTSTGSIEAPQLSKLGGGFLKTLPPTTAASAQGNINLPSVQALFRAPQDPNSPSPGTKQQYDAPYRGVKNQRTPFLFTTIDQKIPPFQFWINPSECSWRIPLRTSIEQIQGGAVHHEWDSIGVGIQSPQKFDQPIINFTFQSGNVAPQSWLDVDQFSQATGASATPSMVLPPGLANFYDFLALLNQPNITKDGQANYVVIEYFSLSLPAMVLYGFFTQEGVQWTDNSDNPNGISSWGASFVVFKAFPDLFDRGSLRNVYSSMFSPQARGINT